MQLGRGITAVKRTPRSTSAGGLTQCAHRQDRTSTGPRRRSEMAACAGFDSQIGRCFSDRKLIPAARAVHRGRHARALSIIASQMPLDLRTSSTASRMAP
jgi:hypothetical protein